MTISAEPRPLTVEANMGLVRSAVKRYRWAIGTVFEESDLMQAGAEGLMRALETFDPSRGFRFSTYATHWLNHFIQRTIANQRRLVRVPVHAQVAAWKRGDSVPLDALSLDAPGWFDDGDSPSWLDRLVSDDRDPTTGVDEQQRRAAIATALARLPERTREILLARFWAEETLQQIAERYGLSRERVRQIEADALHALRVGLKWTA